MERSMPPRPNEKASAGRYPFRTARSWDDFLTEHKRIAEDYRQAKPAWTAAVETLRKAAPNGSRELASLVESAITDESHALWRNTQYPSSPSWASFYNTDYAPQYQDKRARAWFGDGCESVFAGVPAKPDVGLLAQFAGYRWGYKHPAMVQWASAFDAIARFARTRDHARTVVGRFLRARVAFNDIESVRVSGRHEYEHTLGEFLLATQSPRSKRVRGKAKSDPDRHSASGRAIPAWVRVFVWHRDCGRCVHCGGTIDLHFDHIIPYSKGGTSIDPRNVQVLCLKCNTSKGAKIM